MQGFIDDLVDTVIIYRNQINERDQKLGQIIDVNRQQADKLKAQGDELAESRQHVTDLKADLLEAKTRLGAALGAEQDKALAADVKKGLKAVSNGKDVDTVQ